MHMHMHICMCMCVLAVKSQQTLCDNVRAPYKAPPAASVLLCARMQSYLLLECAWLVCIMCIWSQEERGSL